MKIVNLAPNAAPSRLLCQLGARFTVDCLYSIPYLAGLLGLNCSKLICVLVGQRVSSSDK